MGKDSHEDWIETVDNALMDLRTINRDLGKENDTLRSEVERLTAERDRMREALEGLLDTAVLWQENGDLTCNEKTLAEFAEDGLNKYPLENEPTNDGKQPDGIVGSPVGKLSEREYQLRHGNPYDASGLPKELTDD